MSLKGIDAQMMITRSPDFARDASAMLKKPELTQEHLATQQKINDAHDQTKVVKTAESEMDKIRTDVDGGGGSGYDSFADDSESDEEEQDQGPDSGMDVAPGNNYIDIRI